MVRDLASKSIKQALTIGIVHLHRTIGTEQDEVGGASKTGKVADLIALFRGQCEGLFLEG